jgi:hypothetical protein
MSDDKYDKILFDVNGDDFILKYYQNCKIRHPRNVNEYNKLEIISSEIKNKQFFEIGSDPYVYDGYNGQTKSRKSIKYMFKEYIIDIHEHGTGHNEFQYSEIFINIIKHDLPTHILFTIKHFQFHNILGFDDIYKYHPEYFMLENDKNITEILETIKKEKENIAISNETINQENKKIVEQKDELNRLILENKRINKDKQNELDKLILENQQKIDHYRNLEQEIIKVNKEKEIIKEEKRKIAICKEKMAQIKRNLDEEKFKLELEKDRINDVNVDEFINSILN